MASARWPRPGFAAEKLVLVAPNGSFVDLVARFAAALGLREGTADVLRGALEDATGHRLADFDIAPLGVDGAMPDTLVVHDRRDRQVAHAEGEAIATAWPNARLVSTDGLGHERILADPTVVAAAVAHVTGSPAA